MCTQILVTPAQALEIIAAINPNNLTNEDWTLTNSIGCGGFIDHKVGVNTATLGEPVVLAAFFKSQQLSTAKRHKKLDRQADKIANYNTIRRY
jgi:hypothetical protein